MAEYCPRPSRPVKKEKKAKRQRRRGKTKSTRTQFHETFTQRQNAHSAAVGEAADALDGLELVAAGVDGRKNGHNVVHVGAVSLESLEGVAKARNVGHWVTCLWRVALNAAALKRPRALESRVDCEFVTTVNQIFFRGKYSFDW